MPATYDWEFPLLRVHTGMLLGNGTMGAMIWGEGSLLRITVGRADFWDHRGGLPWTEKQSYASIRDCLERGDEEGLRELFEDTEKEAGEPDRPSVLPVGRFDIDFGPDVELIRGHLDTGEGRIVVVLDGPGGRRNLELILDMEHPLFGMRMPDGVEPEAVTPVPAWEYVGDHLADISFEPPRMLDQPLVGWIQKRPADPPLCVGCRRGDGELLIAVACGGEPDAAVSNVKDIFAKREGFGAVLGENRRWWRSYWDRVPEIELPSERLQFLYDYGMYKFAGLTNPEGIPATLQGPWIEEHKMPPWSSDYHFNINVQMCYWPAYHANCPEHLRNLFDMIEDWMPVLRHNARVFLGIDDGVMLPHAVDDRCMCMGGFWTGSIDHGCTAWVAQMMYRYYRYTLDEDFLRETAYPFMKGTMRVYEEMLEKRDGEFVLPVSVSPEYRGSSLDAWGENASFQLACIHRLVKDLTEASDVLDEKPSPLWREIKEKLPRASLIGDGESREIALWDGTPLEESHRHHSHLAGITPFDIFDFCDSQWWGIIKNSLARWIRKGPGLWSGWCVPWASMIHTRVGNADAAELWIEIFDRVFTNEGDGTLHDVNFSGFSLMGRGPVDDDNRRDEIMQIEGGMGAVAAIQEMLLHVRDGVTVLFAGAPRRWKQVRFEDMLTEGAFLISAERTDGRVGPVRVKSTVGGIFRLKNPWDSPAVVSGDQDDESEISGNLFVLEIPEGDTVIIEPKS